MTLRPEDEGALSDLGRPWASQVEGRFLLLVMQGFPVPAGLSPNSTDLLLRLPFGFPDVAPDMFWTDPVVTRCNGTRPPGTQVRQPFVGRTWQRWSRHIGPLWRPGQDGLATYLAYVRRCFAIEAEAI